MTDAERKALLNKECLTIEDFKSLFGVEYDGAAKIMRELKNTLTMGKKQSLRLSIQGKIHTLDYFDAVGAKEYAYRYGIAQEEANDATN